MPRPHAILALALWPALWPLAAPAESLTATWAPATRQEAEALRLALTLHGLRTELRNGGTVRQWGRGHLAALAQGGRGNLGVILQQGEDHVATLSQEGDGNAHAILQAGRGGTAAVEQRGGEIGVTFQLGW